MLMQPAAPTKQWLHVLPALPLTGLALRAVSVCVCLCAPCGFWHKKVTAAAALTRFKVHCLPPHSCLTSMHVPPAATSKDEAMAVLDEEDLDAVGGGWGEEDDVAGAGGNDDADAEAGPRGEGGGLGGSEGDEEGGWEMEVGPGGGKVVYSGAHRVLGTALGTARATGSVRWVRGLDLVLKMKLWWLGRGRGWKCEGD